MVEPRHDWYIDIDCIMPSRYFSLPLKKSIMVRNNDVLFGQIKGREFFGSAMGKPGRSWANTTFSIRIRADEAANSWEARQKAMDLLKKAFKSLKFRHRRYSVISTSAHELTSSAAS